jgi:hypothetical protein
MDRPGQQYPVGSFARIAVSADEGAYVQVLTVDHDGAVDWLYPLDAAGRLASPARPEPRETLWLPGEAEGFAYCADRPAGAAAIYVIAASTALTDADQRRVNEALVAAGLRGGISGAHDALESLARLYPHWRMRSAVTAYEVLDVPGASCPPRLAAASTPDKAAPPPPPVPVTTPPLAWLDVDDPARLLRVELDQARYAAGAPVAIKVTADGPCRLLVLALGSGGMIDELYPNARQPGGETFGGALAIPGSTGLELHTMGTKSARDAEERVVGLCVPEGHMPALPTPSDDAPTARLAPDSAEAKALDALRPLIADLHPAVVRYTVGPARSG